MQKQKEEIVTLTISSFNHIIATILAKYFLVALAL